MAGGHSIDAPEPIYGLAVIGLVHPERVLRNTGARAGDILVLSKGLGVGVISAALKKAALPKAREEALYATLVDSTTRLNAVGHSLASIPQVHAVTDVTGFGLLGHGLEICRGSGLAAHVRFGDLPLLDGVAELARVPYRTGAAVRNWDSYGKEVELAAGVAEWQRDVMADPQTSGGLLIAVAPDGVETVLAQLRAAGFGQAAAIGEMQAGAPRLHVS